MLRLINVYSKRRPTVISLISSRKSVPSLAIICRYRSTKASGSHSPKYQRVLHHEPPNNFWKPPFRQLRESRSQVPFSQQTEDIPKIKESEVFSYFEDNVNAWAKSHAVKERLKVYGIPQSDVIKLLKGFVEDVEDGLLSDEKSSRYYFLERFSHQHDKESIDVIYSTIFFSWVARQENKSKMEEDLGVDSQTVEYIRRLVKITSRPYLADEFNRARMIRRKIIMHVGPTNSGKTHHALRALAAAGTGVYAGPLRLLAHEIWERLNTGQIVPLGMDPTPPSANSQLTGNPAFIRPCNMITGEEQKSVAVDAPLLSCTVEMLPYFNKYDVAVIDEIQMIGDINRGGAWVNAVLGTVADEVHLCGEETAIPIVENLLKHTGDELIVNRYQRLTPLVVEQKSLDGDFSKVQKGDCIVTFKRSSIFEVKKAVEANTGMRCAVVYGRLPPEVRSEQAALFNDPNSGYDVIIGSDAIGMGLNLKIKRVIFEAITKYGNGAVRPLSDSSVKQIAGRAGRYGLHKDQEAGGTTTTLYPADLPHLRKYLSRPYEPLSSARITVNFELIDAIRSILPHDTPTAVALSAPKFIGRLPPNVRYVILADLEDLCNFIDNEWEFMSNVDKILLLNAPLPWRDSSTMAVIKRMLLMHAESFNVHLATAIKGTPFMDTVQYVEDIRLKVERGETTFSSTGTTLQILESFHKVLVFYIWMNFRNAIIYSDPTVVPLKLKVEDLLNWTLSHLSLKDQKRAVKEYLSRSLGKISPVNSRPGANIAYKTHLEIKQELRRAAAA